MIGEPLAYRPDARFKRRDNSITRLTTVETLSVSRYIGIILRKLISGCVDWQFKVSSPENYRA